MLKTIEKSYKVCDFNSVDKIIHAHNLEKLVLRTYILVHKPVPY